MFSSEIIHRNKAICHNRFHFQTVCINNLQTAFITFINVLFCLSFRIEWDAYDYHSGISHLKWRLYSNYSGTDIIHGEIDLPGQGKTQVLIPIFYIRIPDLK